MKYLDDMLEKYGFGDGEAVPAEACYSRQVYLIALNRILEELKSDTRVIAFNRGGMHNGLLIAPCSLETYNSWDERDRLEGCDKKIPPYKCEDGSLSKAYQIAVDLDLDDYLEVEICISHGALKEALSTVPKLVAEHAEETANEDHS